MKINRIKAIFIDKETMESVDPTKVFIEIRDTGELVAFNDLDFVEVEIKIV